MKKKLFAFIVCLVMVVGLLPTIAFADESYNLYVNGEQFTSTKLTIPCGSGTASYDPETETLTLNNAEITVGGKSDENPQYGIRVVGDSDLTIELSGENSINIPDGGGIFADGGTVNYTFIGDGKLSVNVKWDALYTLTGDISIIGGADLDINSSDGCGIYSYNPGNILINNATVYSVSHYTALGAKDLTAVNSDIYLEAKADRFNAAYLGDNNGSGSINITGSKIRALSYSPALFTEGDLTITGGETFCTSTADAAIWTNGNIMLKGSAIVNTFNQYPMGCDGTFTVEAAEVAAQNTNSENIPAIFDESIPEIAEGYRLQYAEAVDSEGTRINLLPSGTQYFALYKNVHFATVSEPVTLQLEISKTVEQAGASAPPAETFEFTLEDTATEKKPLEHYGITADELKIETTGAGTFNKSFDITVDPSNINAANGWNGYGNAGSTDIRWYSKSFLLKEANASKPGWDYSSEEYAVTLQYTLETGELDLRIHVPGNDVYYTSAAYTNIYNASDATVEIPFTKTVKLGGNAAPGKQDFELEIIKNFNSGAENACPNVTVTSKVETDGKGEYTGKLVLSGPSNEIEDFMSEGFLVREKNTKAEGWTYDEAIWAVTPGLATDSGNTYVFFQAKSEQTDNGVHYSVDLDNPAEKMVFTNTYTKNEETTPTSTGDTNNLGLWIVLLVISFGVAAGAVIVGRKKKFNR